MGGRDQVGPLVLTEHSPSDGEGRNLPAKSGCLHSPRAFFPTLDNEEIMDFNLDIAFFIVYIFSILLSYSEDC